MNKDTAVAQANLNRIDSYTPQGSLTYQVVGTNADGTPKYQQIQTYSPAEQQKYDQVNGITTKLNGIATDGLGRVADAQSKPWSTAGMTSQVTSLGQGIPGVQYAPNGSYDPKKDIGTGTDQQQYAPFGIGGDVQKGLNYGGLTQLPGTSDFGAEGKATQDAVYGQATSRLDPQYQQTESDITSKLAAQGISQNSDAYRREMDNFQRGKTDAYNQANYSAIQAGSAEQSRLFGLALNARQQGQNEVNTQGNFANSAQNQGFTQGMATYDQNNQVQDTKLTQAQQIAAFFNTAQGQQYAQDQGKAAFNNTASGQAFNQQAASATVQNAARQQQIQEAAYARSLPLNEISALLGTGTQVTNPNFNPVAQVGVAAPDYMGAVQNNYNAQMNQYNQQMAARSSGLGSIFGALGSVGGGLAMSDIRRKRDIARVSEVNGMPTYSFKYDWSNRREFGVMAQEVEQVRPEAVLTLDDGTMMVNYERVMR